MRKRITTLIEAANLQILFEEEDIRYVFRLEDLCYTVELELDDADFNYLKLKYPKFDLLI